MKKLVTVLLLVISLSAHAQQFLHYEVVYNVYRKDKPAIDQYTKGFIDKNTELFSNITDTINYSQTDSGVVVRCAYLIKKDTVEATTYFLSKDNRVKVIFDVDKIYSNYIKTCLNDKSRIIFNKYKNLLISKRNDTVNW